jgi:hypothetical protein
VFEARSLAVLGWAHCLEQEDSKHIRPFLRAADNSRLDRVGARLTSLLLFEDEVVVMLAPLVNSVWRNSSRPAPRGKRGNLPESPQVSLF